MLTMASAVSAVEGEECGETVTGISGGSAKSCAARSAEVRRCQNTRRSEHRRS